MSLRDLTFRAPLKPLPRDPAVAALRRRAQTAEIQVLTVVLGIRVVLRRRAQATEIKGMALEAQTAILATQAVLRHLAQTAEVKGLVPEAQWLVLGTQATHRTLHRAAPVPLTQVQLLTTKATVTKAQMETVLVVAPVAALVLGSKARMQTVLAAARRPAKVQIQVATQRTAAQVRHSLAIAYAGDVL